MAKCCLVISNLMQSLFMMWAQHFYNIKVFPQAILITVTGQFSWRGTMSIVIPDLQGSSGGAGVAGFIGVITVPVKQEIAHYNIYNK